MTLSILESNHVPHGTWTYELTDADFAKPWCPKPTRIERLRENTRCAGFREHPNIGAYPIVNGMWACARATGPYKGRFPGGFMERFETLVYVFNLVPDFDPNHTMMLFPFGGSVIRRVNLHTIDIKPEVQPTFCGDIASRDFVRTIPDDFYEAILIDPPYDFDNIVYSDKLYKTKKLKPYDFVSANPKKVNITEKVKIGGIVGILHQLVYKRIPLCERVGVITVTTGPNMRVRALNLFVRTEKGEQKH